MKLIFLPVVLLLTSCAAGLIGGVAGGAAGAKGPDPDTVQIVALRSRYQVDCNTIKDSIADFTKHHEEIVVASLDAPNICEEIKSSNDIYKSCIKTDPSDEYRIADGTFWTSYNFYLIQIQKNEKSCDLLLYTRLDFDLKGNPFSTKSSCQNGLDKECEAKLQKAKSKRDEIKLSIEKRSKIVFNDVKEEKIFNYYSTETALNAFKK